MPASAFSLPHSSARHGQTYQGTQGRSPSIYVSPLPKIVECPAFSRQKSEAGLCLHISLHTHIFCVCLSHTNADICTFLSPTYPLLPSLHPHLFLLSLALSSIPVSLSSQWPLYLPFLFSPYPPSFPSISTNPMSSHCFYIYLPHICAHILLHILIHLYIHA